MCEPRFVVRQFIGKIDDSSWNVVPVCLAQSRGRCWILKWRVTMANDKRHAASRLAAMIAALLLLGCDIAPSGSGSCVGRSDGWSYVAEVELQITQSSSNKDARDLTLSKLKTLKIGDFSRQSNELSLRLDEVVGVERKIFYSQPRPFNAKLDEPASISAAGRPVWTVPIDRMIEARTVGRFYLDVTAGNSTVPVRLECKFS